MSQLENMRPNTYNLKKLQMTEIHLWWQETSSNLNNQRNKLQL